MTSPYRWDWSAPRGHASIILHLRRVGTDEGYCRAPLYQDGDARSRLAHCTTYRTCGACRRRGQKLGIKEPVVKVAKVAVA